MTEVEKKEKRVGKLEQRVIFHRKIKKKKNLTRVSCLFPLF